jgi:hypothetical protein
MDEETRRELRRKKLSFTCKDPWESGHRCMGKGKAHYIEVFSDEEDNEETSHDQGETHDNPKEEQSQGAIQKDESPHTEPKKAVIATLSGIRRYHTFQIRGAVQGH